MDLQLRDECRNLLTKLRVSQKCIKEQIQSSRQLDITSSEYDDHNSYDLNSRSKFGDDITGHVNISKDTNTDLKPTYARSKLLSLCKSSTSESDKVFDMNTTNLKDKENNHVPITVNSHESHQCKDWNASNSNWDSGSFSSTMPSTTAVSPSRMKKRQLIDKHTTVQTRLNSNELKELDDERLLNFNYSNISVDKNSGIKSLTSSNDHDKEENSREEKRNVFNSAPSNGSSEVFQEQLQDLGNDRRHSHWLKEATIKPKTLLNSTNYYSLSKRGNNSKVRFDSSSHEEIPVADQRLLGYDWIAALLDNEQTVINQSESFFHDLCDFRKAYKDECNNKFYMESPYTLVDREPEPVVDALTEPKVRPFVVNERLFTEPLTSDLIESSYEKDTKKQKSKEPTKENPRFVRVSIPRSTLQTPYRVRPHRRGSFDGSDSCSLTDHCLLGWENTVPSLMPPAKSLSLAADAGTQINSQTTTLAEAERLATVHNQVQWHLSRPSAQVQTLPRWRKHYMDMTLNMSLPSHLQDSANASTVNQSSNGGHGDVKRKTDRILQATYSTMYEMERLRRERELEKEKDHV